MMKRRNFLAGALAAPSVTIAATANPKLKFLQIGTGHGHANKIGVYEASDDWEVVGIVEEDPELRALAQASETFRDFPFLSLEEGLNTKWLSVVGIETKVQDLLRYAQIALDAGFHLHLDKPAGASYPAYERLMKQADASDRIVQMGYMYRFTPAVELLHRILEEGWLGEVFETHAVMSKVMPEAAREEVDDFVGGTMFELGCHIIDLTMGVLGEPDQVTPYPRRVIERDEDSLIDNMLAVFEYPKATASVRSSALEVDGFARRHFTVCGTEGTLHIQPLDRPTVRLSLSQERTFAGGGETLAKGRSEIVYGPYPRYIGDAADLAATIRGEKENAFPSSYDLAVQRAVLEAAGMTLK